MRNSSERGAQQSILLSLRQLSIPKRMSGGTVAVTGRRRKINHIENARLRRSGSRLGYPPV
ncbi:hypothetical protein RBSWK_01568 [Rhodopirellula baltica SWK14]|uniref:Uncharacterized protein n=1 Tax=Rhodopirellula baltica SWK14 TaxID=993516 RepID=L7CLL3_RHOBT|nr:hypothetical protein RBSWK_01568 [Rhodopirellula baltica SWK14]